mgnify:CR=1 FL=1|jgi:hypothetical protein
MSDELTLDDGVTMDGDADEEEEGGAGIGDDAGDDEGEEESEDSLV